MRNALSMLTTTRLPVRLLLCWSFLLFLCYVFLLEPKALVHQSYAEGLQEEGAITHEFVTAVDALVYVAMGAMAKDHMVDYSISSVRKIGGWTGPVYLVTDSPSCFDEAVAKHGVKLIVVAPLASIIEIKALKPKLLGLLPKSVQGLLYLDVDIVVTHNLDSFIKDLSWHLFQQKQKQQQIQLQRSSKSSSGNTTLIAPSIPLPFDYGAFPDAKGHYVGFCSGCEKWHTGILWLRRGSGQKCLKAWEEILLSGKFDTDQESMDEAELKSGSCQHAYAMPSRYLLFAKDYIAMALTVGHTFLHVTSAGRIESQDYLYRKLVVPRLRASLGAHLDPSLLEVKKECSSSSSSSSSGSSSALDVKIPKPSGGDSKSNNSGARKGDVSVNKSKSPAPKDSQN